jgi:predicted ATPase/class 3 adenylate cyclase
MPNFEGYENLEKIAEGKDRTIYSAIRVTDRMPVILKTLRSQQPSVDMIALMYHEFEVAKDINYPGIIKTYAMIDEHNRYALVQENMNGISLHRYLEQNREIELPLFLKLAIQMVQILDYLHQSHIIHKDIKPSNFIYDQMSGILKLTDFNYSTKLKHETQDIVPPSKLEGTLAYMAPEQTGRMNMNIDYRADYYALGVTFYEMLTGTLPYKYTDPLEMLHAHIANPIPEITNLDIEIPPVIYEIIVKLMAKSPNDRYQSTVGLQSDLEHCLELLENNGRIKSFPLAKHDIQDHLIISQKLYGRENEIQLLLKTYEHISQGSVEALMVYGFSGIGKTMLIDEVHKPMTKHKGYFIRGKYDQLYRDKPYTAITDALNQLARNILAEPEENFEKIKTSILNEMGGSGQIIIDLAPEFALVIGPQPPLDELPQKETEIRMKTFFKRFIHALIGGDHPFVMFIDDLQWADSGSLSLLEDMILDTEMHHLLFIGAYRDNEVDALHPLRKMIEKLEARKNIRELPLPPLRVEDYSAALQDTFYRDSDSVADLAKLLHQRTQGNPFFFKQVIQLIYDQGLLKFNYQNHHWGWNLSEIAALGITDNVVDLMLNKMAELPEETLSLMKYASCIGNQFSIDMLMLITNQSPDEIGKKLWPALEQELLITPRAGYKRMDAMQNGNIINLLSKDITYQFIHDRVQQAAYQSISENEKSLVHLDIAHILMKKYSEATLKDKIFEVVDHFNHAIQQIPENERNDVAKLNYLAGLQAKRAIAYQPMLNYLSTALKLINESTWESNYQFAFNINRDHLLALVLLRKSEEANTIAKTLLMKAKANLDKAQLYHILIIDAIIRIERTQALDSIQQVLKLFGIKLILNPNTLQLFIKIMQVRWKMRKFLNGSFAENLPVLTNPEIAIVFDILSESYFLFYEKGTSPFVYMILITMELMLRYGKPKSAGFWLTAYAIMIINVYKDIETAIQYCDIAERYYLSIPDKYSSATAHLWTSHLINHWFRPLKKSFELCMQAQQEARESGNVIASLTSMGVHIFNIAAEAKSIDKYIEYMSIVLRDTQLKEMKSYYDHTELLFLIYVNLKNDRQGMSDRLSDLITQFSTFESFLIYTTSNKYLSFYYFFKNDDEKSIDRYFMWQQFEEKIRYEIFTLEIKAINALSIMRQLPKVDSTLKRKYKKHLKKLFRDVEWGSKYAPMNYLHQYLFLKGYEEQSNKKYIQALNNYKLAIENAQKGGFILWVALVSELTGDLFIEIGQEKFAISSYRDAYYYYNRYGMMSKVHALISQYPEFSTNESSLTTNTLEEYLSSSESSTSSGSTSASLDFMSVIKASQAISSEIVFDKLFEKMLHVIFENAGATKAVLIERRKENLFEAASLELIQGEEVFSMINQEIRQSNHISQNIVQYTIRSRESLAIDKAFADDRFNQDPYIIQNQPKSILCLPILHQDIILGVIYLENNITEGAFTKDRITVLQTLAAQIAISMQNSQYIANMEKLYHSTERFVPKQFLEIINKRNIEEVVLGDSAKRNITILFNDIRSFTTLVEDRSPEDAFAFVNRYWKFMAPIIRKYNGYIDHYQGDAILAIFSNKPQDAVLAAINIMHALEEFNKAQLKNNDVAISMGIGISTGPAMLGIIGEEERQVSGLISDVANTASRVEGLNKLYGSRILISSDTAHDLPNDLLAQFRKVDVVRLKGKHLPTEIYEFIEWQDQLTSPLSDYLNTFTNAFTTYENGNFKEAQRLFQVCLNVYPGDKAAEMLRKRCIKLEKVINPEDWDGVYTLTHK